MLELESGIFPTVELEAGIVPTVELESGVSPSVELPPTATVELTSTMELTPMVELTPTVELIPTVELSQSSLPYTPQHSSSCCSKSQVWVIPSNPVSLKLFIPSFMFLASSSLRAPLRT